MFNMSRLDLARQRRGLTKRELAHKLGVTDRTLVNWSNGGSIDDNMADKIAQTLNFPASFFYEADIDEVKTESVSFRALSKLTAKKRDIALSQTRLAKLLNAWIDENFNLPEVNVPNLHELRNDYNEDNSYALSESTPPIPQTYLKSDGSSADDFCKNTSYPEACAEVLRKFWGLGEQPIPNLIALLESKGIRIFSLSDDAQEVDACCTWSAGRPFIFLNMAKTAERCRFDAAHELGHLVMHQHGVVEGKQIEQEANAFASAFLMPRRSILAAPVKNPTLKSIISRKHIWRVSAAALTYRYHKLGLISDWNSISIYKQLAKYGKNFEPEGLPHETSLLLTKVLAALRLEKTHAVDIAKELHVSLEDFDSLTFGLAKLSTDEQAERKRQTIRLLD